MPQSKARRGGQAAGRLRAVQSTARRLGVEALGARPSLGGARACIIQEALVSPGCVRAVTTTAARRRSSSGPAPGPVMLSTCPGPARRVTESDARRVTPRTRREGSDERDVLTAYGTGAARSTGAPPL